MCLSCFIYLFIYFNNSARVEGYKNLKITPVQTWCQCPGSKMAVVQTHRPVPWSEHVHKRLGKGFDYRENGGKFGVGASTAFERANTAGPAGENLSRLK